MSSMQPLNAAFLPFAATLVFLCLKALLLGTATAAMRGKHKRFINAEDAVWLGGEAVGLDADPGARIGRSHRNDLENLLLFAVLASMYLALGGPAVAAWIYSGVFLFARFGHTLAYLASRPALRRNCYMLGFFVILALAAHCLLMLPRLA